MIRNPQLIDETYQYCVDELGELAHRKGLSSYLSLTQLLAKSFLLSCASFYEDEIVKIVKGIVESGSHQPCIESWLSREAVDGKFYKWFNFRGNTSNTNSFLSMFGSDFKRSVRKMIDKSDKRKNAEQSFIYICVKRNECVHRNYIAYNLELTIDDIYAKHKNAMTFIRAFELNSKKLKNDTVLN